MTCKFSLKEIRSIFEYLDWDNDGVLSYNEFCNICEERWWEIDPFDTGRALRLREIFKTTDPYRVDNGVKTIWMED